MAQKRRVVIYLEVDGSAEDATRLRDVAGCALDGEFIGAIITDIVQERKIKDVKWEVHGESLEETPAPVPGMILSAMEEM